MLKILTEISKRAILLNEFDITGEQVKTNWLGNQPACIAEVEAAEKRLGVKFPKDYVDLLLITNGFPEVTVTGTGFLPVGQIDYLHVLDDDLVDLYCDFGEPTYETAKILSESIVIGDSDTREQYFLLRPPNDDVDKWRYYYVPTYCCQEWEFKGITAYLKNGLSDLRTDTKGLRKQKPKEVIDYSLRDAFFNADWELVFATAIGFLKEYNNHFYQGGDSRLLELLLLTAYKLNNFEELAEAIKKIRTANRGQLPPGVSHPYNDIILYKYQIAGGDKVVFIAEDYKELPETEKYISLQEIEQDIIKNDKNLLKPKNAEIKINTILGRYFMRGSKNQYIELYEKSDPDKRQFFSILMPPLCMLR